MRNSQSQKPLRYIPILLLNYRPLFILLSWLRYQSLWYSLWVQLSIIEQLLCFLRWISSLIFYSTRSRLERDSPLCRYYLCNYYMRFWDTCILVCEDCDLEHEKKDSDIWEGCILKLFEYEGNWKIRRNHNRIIIL